MPYQNWHASGIEKGGLGKSGNIFKRSFYLVFFFVLRQGLYRALTVLEFPM